MFGLRERRDEWVMEMEMETEVVVESCGWDGEMARWDAM